MRFHRVNVAIGTALLFLGCGGTAPQAEPSASTSAEGEEALSVMQCSQGEPDVKWDFTRYPAYSLMEYNSKKDSWFEWWPGPSYWPADVPMEWNIHPFRTCANVAQLAGGAVLEDKYPNEYAGFSGAYDNANCHRAVVLDVLNYDSRYAGHGAKDGGVSIILDTSVENDPCAFSPGSGGRPDKPAPVTPDTCAEFRVVAYRYEWDEATQKWSSPIGHQAHATWHNATYDSRYKLIAPAECEASVFFKEVEGGKHYRFAFAARGPNNEARGVTATFVVANPPDVFTGRTR
jgi:hypothetical protein